MGGARHSQVTNTTGWPGWLQEDVNQYIGQYMNTALPGGQVEPYNPALNQQVAPFNATQNQAFGDIMNTAGGVAPYTGATLGNLTATEQGQYLDPSSNPWLRGTYDQAAQAMSDQYKYATAPSLMAAAQGVGGTTQGTGYQDSSMLARYELGQNLANLGNRIYGGNYQAERGNQIQAANMMPSVVQGAFAPAQAELGVGGLQQQQQQSVYDTSQQNAMRQFQYPYTVLDQLGGALGTARGPSGVSQTWSPNRAGWLK